MAIKLEEIKGFCEFIEYKGNFYCASCKRIKDDSEDICEYCLDKARGLI